MLENNNTTSSISFSGLLFITFLVLKLTKVIDWSWWWIFAPLWLPVSILILFLIIWGLIIIFQK
jgi:hypothetical protein